MTERIKVLVVDDDQDTLDLIRLSLSTNGFVVQTIPSGIDALAALSEEAFDLILLDVMMPEVSGFDVLRGIQRDGIPAPPVVILTARDRSEDRQLGLDLGATDYLIKPVERGKLLNVIEMRAKQGAVRDADHRLQPEADPGDAGKPGSLPDLT